MLSLSMLQYLYKTCVAFGILSFLFMFVGGSFLVLASEQTAEKRKAEELDRIEEEVQRYYEQIEGKYSDRISTHQTRLFELKEELEEYLQEFDAHQNDIAEKERALRILSSRLITLNGQLEYLQDELETTEYKIQKTGEQIAVRESGLAKVMEEKEVIHAEADVQKDVVMSYFSLLQTESESLQPFDVTTGLSIVLSDDSFTQNLRDEMHFTALEKSARSIFHDLEGALLNLEEVDSLLSRERSSLTSLQNELAQQEQTLSLQRKAQQDLITQTQGEQEQFEILLRESKAQLRESAEQITDLQADLNTINRKLETLENRQGIEKSVTRDRVEQLLLDEESSYEAGEEFILQDIGKKPFSWSVEPLKITSYFKDASYQRVFGVEHNALDIRAPQGTSIRAPAAGYVYKTIDNGRGYSYIVLIHRNNLMTVYGHVSGFDVTEGDLVQEGESIGKTGGTIGTKGAGVMTTGPHLHFEVWENGVVQNPLDYLPLDELPPEDVPEEYFLQELGLSSDRKGDEES